MSQTPANPASLRPTRRFIRAELVVLGLCLVGGILTVPAADWDLLLFASLLAISVLGDLFAVETASDRVKVSSSFLAIVTAIVFLGVAPGIAIAMLTILITWARARYAADDLLVNLVTYAGFPLVAGVAFHAVADATATAPPDPSFYLLVFALFVVALAIDFTVIALYSCYVEGGRFAAKVRDALLPLLPSELASAFLAVGIAFAYVHLGISAVALFGFALLAFQYLIGALLVSQERALELELRAQQLAGSQMGLLSVMLRSLDMRDRHTARHSAAVARYVRRMADALGLSEEEQEIAHTAGLLHDIGKFSFPDRILKGNQKLTEDDWKQIRKHPYQGAQIVSQVDGYQPIGEIILAHHERVDGLGYPRGIEADAIPRVSRMISIADTYDVMTARDSYRDPVSPYEAVAELRRVSGTQLDGELVELFVELLESEGVAFHHGEDADFDAELAIEKRSHSLVTRGLRSARWSTPAAR